MKRDDSEFMERITCDLDAHKAACKVLGVPEGFDMNSLKKAYRRASLKYHPDHNQNDPDANKKFALVKCAYELLAKDTPARRFWKKSNPGPEFQKMIGTDLIVSGDTFCGGVKSFSAEYRIYWHGEVLAIL